MSSDRRAGEGQTDAAVQPHERVVVEYEHWWDDADSTPHLVGPFASIPEAQAWAKEAWEDDYDPRWSVRVVRWPWKGRMTQRGAIRG